MNSSCKAPFLFLAFLAGCQDTESPSTNPERNTYERSVDEARRLEFLHAEIPWIQEDPDGMVHVVLGPSSRAFAIFPSHPDAKDMREVARAAHASGDAVHATLDVSRPVPSKSPEAARAGGGPTPIIRLARTPDPRARERGVR